MLKTSVIVPVYNVEEYLEECLESIFGQTQQEIEVIAIDDGSTDGSLSILHRMQKKHHNLQVITQDNHGQGYARNVGIELAQGEFLYFIDADDYLGDTTALEKCYTCAINNNLDIVTFDAEIFGDIESFSHNQYDRFEILPREIVMSGMEMLCTAYKKNSFIVSPCLLYISANFLHKYKFRYPTGIYYEDNLFYCQVISSAERVMYISQAFYQRRYRPGSTMTSPATPKKGRSLLQIAASVCALCDEREGDERRWIFKDIALRLLQAGARQCLLLGESIESRQLADEIWDKALQIYEIESETEEYQFKSRISSLAYRLNKKLPVKLSKNIRDSYRQLFSSIPLHMDGALVGIYGTGKYTDKFFTIYEEYREIKAEIIFIDSYKASHISKYRNKEIYNVADIGSLKLDCVVVSSSKYEDEMYEGLRERYGGKFPIICLRKDLNFR